MIEYRIHSLSTISFARSFGLIDNTIPKISSASLVAPSMSEACPLCFSPLVQQVLQPTKALKTCTNESCVFPFNLNTAELSAQGLLYTVNDDAIVAPMLPQMEAAGVDPRLAYFIVRPDDDIHQHPQL